MPPTPETPAHQQPPFAWARLNADTILLAVLALIGGSYDIADPTHDLTVQALGHTTPAYFLCAGTFIAAGVLILFALARQRTADEVFGRALLVAGLLIQIARTGFSVGWWEPITIERHLLLVAVVGVSYLRLSALLASGGLAVHIPPRNGHS